MKSHNGLKDLNKKWHKSLKSDILRLELPLPDHDYGWSEDMLMNNLSAPEFKQLCNWMYGQTCVRDEKLGIIYYTTDVIRGLDFIRHGKGSYFD